MQITYDDAVKAQKQLEAKVFADPNVVSIGVVKETNKLGQYTGDYAVQVGVISIDTYTRMEKLGLTDIPNKFSLQRSEDSGTKQVHINVVKIGKIKALSPSVDNNFETKKWMLMNSNKHYYSLESTYHLSKKYPFTFLQKKPFSTSTYKMPSLFNNEITNIQRLPSSVLTRFSLFNKHQPNRPTLGVRPRLML